MADPANDNELTAAVERYIDQMGWTQSDLVLTDVLVVTVRHGFDRQGGKSVINVITPTDSMVPLLLGMSRYAGMRFEKTVMDSFVESDRRET